jgi:hypothetical protein
MGMGCRWVKIKNPSPPSLPLEGGGETRGVIRLASKASPSRGGWRAAPGGDGVAARAKIRCKPHAVATPFQRKGVAPQARGDAALHTKRGNATGWNFFRRER